MRITRVIAAVITCAAAQASVASAAIITESRLDTSDIVIPVFNTSLGTLTNVSLTVTLKAGTTSIGGGHDHATISLQSSNTLTMSSFGFPPIGGFGGGTTTSTTTPGHTHSVLTPGYSGGGLNLGTFSFSTDLEGGHSHVVNYSYLGLTQVGPTSWRAVAQFDPQPFAGGTATYGGETKGFGFSGAFVSPFLAASDIVIGAAGFSTSLAGTHNHLVSFNPTVSAGFSPGFWTWNFSGTLPAVGDHSLTLDPRFDVVAEFTYTEPQAVPEPGSMVLLGTGFLGMIGQGVRRRRMARRSPGF